MKDRLDGWTWNSGGGDTEADPGPPRGDRYAVPRMHRTPAQSARAAVAWIRTRWIRLVTVTTVLVLALGGWQTYTYLTRFHEQMTGPHGAFPTALGTAAPERPDRVLASGNGAPAEIAGGLVLHERDYGVMASSVRTGRTYWHYGREKTTLIAESVVGDAVVLWYGDGLAVSVDLRSGKPRWHTKLAGQAREDTGDRVWRAGKTVIINQQDRLTSLSAGNGKLLWSLAPPKGCKAWDRKAPVGLSGTAAFDATHCSETEGVSLYGVDTADGRTRWHIRNEVVGYGSLGDHTLVSVGVTGSLVTVDVSGPRPRMRSSSLSPETYLRGISSGMILLSTGKDTSLTARQVSSDSSSKVLWTVKAEKGRVLGIPRVADGRVYIPQYQSPARAEQHKAPGPPHLLVLDSRTGHELHRTALPASLYRNPNAVATGTMAVLGANSGVVRVGWIGFLVSSEDQVALAE